MNVLLSNQKPSRISKLWEKHLKQVEEYLTKQYPRYKDLQLDIRVRNVDSGGMAFVLEVTYDAGRSWRPHVWTMSWKIQPTPACCAFPLLHTFHVSHTANDIFPALGWIVQTLNARYWMDLGSDLRSLEDWEFEQDPDYDDDPLQHCMQLNLIEGEYPFWHWFAKQYGQVEGSFGVFNHNSGREVEVVVSRFS